MNDEQLESFMVKHDKRASAIQAVLAPIYEKIEKLSEKTDDKIERCLETISIKMSSVLLHQTEIKKDLEHIVECQKKATLLQEKHDDLIDEVDGRLQAIETNWKWVMGIAGVVGGLASLIITPILELFKR